MHEKGEKAVFYRIPLSPFNQDAPGLCDFPVKPGHAGFGSI